MECNDTFPSQNKALQILEKIYGKLHTEVADCYDYIGIIYREQNNYVNALEAFQLALISNSATFDDTDFRHNPDLDNILADYIYLNSLI